MYERTPLSRGESLDPNPLGQGEYIEHKHSPVTCNSALRSFPMLRVCLLHSSLQSSRTLIIVAFIIPQHPITVCVLQKAKADPRPVSPPAEGEVPVRKHKCSLIDLIE